MIYTEVNGLHNTKYLTNLEREYLTVITTLPP